MIFVTGAGGKTGRTLIKTLSKVETICALVHREAHIPVLKSLGANQVIVGDLQDKALMQSALQGVRGVYHICPNMNSDEIEIGRVVIEQARKAGVEHLVYHSVLHPQTAEMKHHWQKLHVEEMLFESGVPFTILQPAPYMQNFLAGWKSIIDDGVLRAPYSVHSKFSFVDLSDVAEAAKIVLTEPGHINAIYELAGTWAISHMEVAEIFSRVLNRDVHAKKEASSSRILRAAGMSDYAIESLLKMFEYYDQWGLVGNPNVLRWILKREPTSVGTFVDRIARERSATAQ